MQALLKKNVILLLCFCYLHSSGQNIISGYITDKTSREPLAGVSILDTLSKRFTISNEKGYYNLEMRNPNAYLIFSAVGYENISKNMIGLKAVNRTDIEMQTRDYALLQVTVNSSRMENPETTMDIGKISLTGDQIKQIPSIAGEKDIIKALTTLPGATAGREGQSNLIVRGGGIDQNVFLLDGAPIYGTGHFLNLLSYFSADMVRYVDLYKGGFPARYGGRLSSVVDIVSRDGNRNQWQGKAELGAISAKLLIEGPLSKSKKTSMLFNARSMYYDLFTRQDRRFAKAFYRGTYTNFRFFDLNLKVNHEINDHSKIFANFFYSYDNLEQFEGDTEDSGTLGTHYTYGFDIKSYTGLIKYINSISPRLFLQTGLYMTGGKDSRGADVNVDIIEPWDNIRISPVFKGNYLNAKYDLSNRIQNIGLFAHLDYKPDWRHNLRLGTHLIQHAYIPSDYLFEIKNYVLPIADSFYHKTTEIIRARELSVYIEDEITLNENFSIQPGLRLNIFLHNSASFFRPDPRINLRYTIKRLATLKLGISKVSQFNQALVSNDIMLDKLVWVPATDKLIPGSSWQVSGGIFKYFEEKSIEISLEGYYKLLTHLIDYRNFNWEDSDYYYFWEENALPGGKGKSTGFEFYVRKSFSRLAGSISYSMSRTTRSNPAFNSGAYYPFRYDNLYAFNTLFSYKWSKRWEVNAYWIIKEGDNFALPLATVEIDGDIAPDLEIISGRNEINSPPYHRLDLSFQYTKTYSNKNSFLMRFDFYNVYNRKNVVFLYKGFIPVGLNGSIVSKPVVNGTSLLPFIPGISFGYQFN